MSNLMIQIITEKRGGHSRAELGCFRGDKLHYSTPGIRGREKGKRKEKD